MADQQAADENPNRIGSLGMKHTKSANVPYMFSELRLSHETFTDFIQWLFDDTVN